METDKWVDEQLRAAEEEWAPDVNAGLALLKQRRAQRERRIVTSVTAVGIVLIVAGASLVAFLERGGVSAADRVLKDRQSAPDFALKDATGATVRISNYRKKVVLVNFWATWCHGCQMEIPWFMELQNKYKDKGLMVIGVSMDDDGFKSVAPFCTMKGMKYPVVIGSAELAKRYGVESMPETVLVDGSGKIAAMHTGVVDKKVLEREIRTLLD
jgi:peroxiredoxin